MDIFISLTYVLKSRTSGLDRNSMFNIEELLTIFILGFLSVVEIMCFF